MKVTGRKIFLKGRCANGDAIEFDCCPGRSAGDFESMGERGNFEAQKQ
jgi:hypothetical protein